MDGLDKPPASVDANAPLKQRIARCHNRLKEARSDGQRAEIITTLTAEMDEALEELHDRVTTAQLENLYADD